MSSSNYTCSFHVYQMQRRTIGFIRLYYFKDKTFSPKSLTEPVMHAVFGVLLLPYTSY